MTELTPKPEPLPLKLTSQHKAIIREVRLKLCDVAYGPGAVAPIVEEHKQVVGIITQLEYLLGVKA